MISFHACSITSRVLSLKFFSKRLLSCCRSHGFVAEVIAGFADKEQRRFGGHEEGKIHFLVSFSEPLFDL